MKLTHTLPFMAVCAASSLSAQTAEITVENTFAGPRQGEVIALPFDSVAACVPGGLDMFHFVVRDVATNAIVPSQVTNFVHDDHGKAYDDLVIDHDFGAGEKAAHFIIEKSVAPVLPYETRTFARYVPERYDDFAWENDRIGHRIYGPTLGSTRAGKEQLRSSGIDIWAKHVRYSVIDRWYAKGHDQFHRDDGEGMDLYSIGGTRGCGGTGVWDGKTLYTSDNWASWKVLANGPIRSEFEVTYAPWAAGALKVGETKRFTIDAGRNFTLVESTFTIEGGDGTATIALGISHPRDKAVEASFKSDAAAGVMNLWQVHPRDGGVGIAVILLPGQGAASVVDEKDNHLLTVKVKNGDTLRYYVGAGWDKSLDFHNQADWDAYVDDFAARTKVPLQVSVAAK